MGALKRLFCEWAGHRLVKVWGMTSCIRCGYYIPRWRVGSVIKIKMPASWTRNPDGSWNFNGWLRVVYVDKAHARAALQAAGGARSGKPASPAVPK